jgi:hypothetical protein
VSNLQQLARRSQLFTSKTRWRALQIADFCWRPSVLLIGAFQRDFRPTPGEVKARGKASQAVEAAAVAGPARREYLPAGLLSNEEKDEETAAST